MAGSQHAASWLLAASSSCQRCCAARDPSALPPRSPHDTPPVEGTCGRHRHARPAAIARQDPYKMTLVTLLPLLLLLLLLPTPAVSAPAAAKVVGLPGWSGPLPSNWYSDFLALPGTTKSLHYVFVEAETNPAEKPLLLWLNGGPGCSSLDGLMYEHGPLLINHDGTQLIKNPYSWSTLANVLYLEAPAGVGFSYSTNTNDYMTGANQTAIDNMAALRVWYSQFPEFATNDFFISGESYGGIYVPTLSQKVFGSGLFPQFKGFLVGNGAWGGDSVTGDCGGPDASLKFLYGHGAVSDRLYTKIQSACTASPDGQVCMELHNEAQLMANGLNM
eukprot:COSAG01_NODE_1966_length_8778_cov_41.983176_12_plen_332_part_00